MKVAAGPNELADAIGAAKIEAKTAFGDDAVYLEKYLAKPRHIEIQVLGDGQGQAIHLGERDCSLQRRHQKIWEEGPSPALNGEQREEIGGIVARAMAGARLQRRGTVEFLYEDGQVLFHRDEHAHSGRASGDGNDHRHRHHQRADQDRRGLPAFARAGGHPHPGRGDRVPHQRRESANLRALAGKDSYFHPPGGWASGSIPRFTRAM